MKFSWSKLVHEMRVRMMELTVIEGHDREHTMDLVGYFRMTMRETDTFHAFDHDFDLDRAFTRLPDRCNYRNLEKYRAYKASREELIGWVYDYFEAMAEIIRGHFSNPMNFPPGYRQPKSVTFKDLDRGAEKCIPMTIRLIRVK